MMCAIVFVTGALLLIAGVLYSIWWFRTPATVRMLGPFARDVQYEFKEAFDESILYLRAPATDDQFRQVIAARGLSPIGTDVKTEFWGKSVYTPIWWDPPSSTAGTFANPGTPKRTYAKLERGVLYFVSGD